MPHITLEYTNNLKDEIRPQELFAPCHRILVEVASTDLESCKSRALKHETFYIGDGDAENAFIHMEILFAEGRSQSIRQEIGAQILKLLESYFARSVKELNLQITVEIKEFPKNLYFKIPANSV